MLPRAAQRCQLGGSGTSASGWSLAIALLLNLLALRAFVACQLARRQGAGTCNWKLCGCARGRRAPSAVARAIDDAPARRSAARPAPGGERSRPTLRSSSQQLREADPPSLAAQVEQAEPSAAAALRGASSWTAEPLAPDDAQGSGVGCARAAACWS